MKGKLLPPKKKKKLTENNYRIKPDSKFINPLKMSNILTPCLGNATVSREHFITK